MSLKDNLKDAIESDEGIRLELLPLALWKALGDSSSTGAVEDEGERDQIIVAVLDVVEQGIGSAVSICREIGAGAAGGPSADGSKERLISVCSTLSAIDEAICRYQRLRHEGFGSLCSEPSWQSPELPTTWYESMLDKLPSWLNEVADHAERLEGTVREDVPDIGEGYFAGAGMVDLAYVGDDDFGRCGKIAKEYEEAGMPPFIMPLDDYYVFVEEVASHLCGHGYSEDRDRLCRRLKAACVFFDCDADSCNETCIALPFSAGKAFYRPYGSLEKRWRMDIPHLSRRDVKRAMEAAKRDNWEKPDFNRIKFGSF